MADNAALAGKSPYSGGKIFAFVPMLDWTDRPEKQGVLVDVRTFVRTTTRRHCGKGLRPDGGQRVG
ncbi:hypothetical protein [Gellertiella hungarica]|uniref:Uncharacterized protein n=1 Tax=Gellertiella hungarica TaxID=1572859 RepID=A0A7W6NN15_9HYPH|nr:hypothetical protein [Gellertiella hungarica]MBB4067000.1 hypothetical protein [Gellertiella hungarica]